MIEAKIIADSISEAGKRLTTLQLVYPRFIHSELMTHRVFSRNASSSRAIPVKKMLEMVRNEPAMPIHWGRNQPGMQADEQLIGVELDTAKALWIDAAEAAAEIAEHMMGVGLHKQVANRILEPFQHISVVLTATEFDNWFELRAHKDAQPEIQMLAVRMLAAMGESTPKLLLRGEWHLPYVSAEDQSRIGDIDLCRKVSAARCCRVSHLKHDGTASSIEEDLSLCDRLVGAEPLHASPFEHQATPDQRLQKPNGEFWWANGPLHGNLVGWIQSRKLIERQFWL
jgi:hypothetical protein